MKKRINWGILLLAAFLMLITSDCKNLKYLPNLIKELHKLFKKNSIYKEDGDFVLIHKNQIKNL
jgi:hypothetical protein